MFALLLCLFLDIVKLVLSIFRDSLFSLNQLEIFFNSYLNLQLYKPTTIQYM